MLHNMHVLAVGEHFFIISKMSKTSCLGHFINIIDRTLHGRLGIRFYLPVLKVSLTSERSEQVRDTFSARGDKICFPPRGHVISYFIKLVQLANQVLL